MIALIAALAQLTLLILQEIFGAVGAANAAKQVVDASNSAFAALVVKCLNKIGQAKYTITLAEDSAVDAEIKGKGI